MINAIGEATRQQFVRTSYDDELFAKDQEAKKADKVKEPRPVEKSDDSQKSEMGFRARDSIKYRKRLEDGQLVVEQYNEDGNLIKKTLPGYLPFAETA
jgi:hypothetical protein